MSAEDLSRLLDGLTDEQVETLLASLPEPAARALLASLGKSGSREVTSPMEQAHEADPGYRTRPHLTHVSDVIADAVKDVENGKSRRLILAMPPRSGKSTLTTQHAPSWILRQHPDWPIALVSHDPTLAISWGRQIRRWVEDGHVGDVQIAPDAGAVSEWQTTVGGGVLSRSTRGSLTGRGARVMLIDDPHKDFVEAHSATERQRVWDWWLTVAQTRLEPPSLVIIVMCMTGDTPVLRPDGSETPLRDIRPGDEIATYEDGKLSTSIVRNWANQGPDRIYSIRMESGRTVRANARHPFLVVDENGAEEWVRLGSLRAGMRVRSLAEPTPGSPAQSTGATPPRSARACACATTGEPATSQGTDHPRTTLRDDGRSGSKAGTGSLRRTTTSSLTSRAVSARSAAEGSTRLPDPGTGPRSSVSTTITPCGAESPCEGCCATTATSSSPEGTTPRLFDEPLSTWRLGTDAIVSIDDAGVEDVFDIEVERTENFIANGLASHNTRWHEDDLVGRLLSPDYEGDSDDWTVVSIPAIAEEDDALGREPEEPLLSPLLEETREEALQRWEDVKRAVGTYAWSALFQQRPAPSSGSTFDVSWWRYWTRDPGKVTDDGRVVMLPDLSHATHIESWDMAFKDTKASDYVVGQRWARLDANRYLLAQTRGKWTFTETKRKVQDFAEPETRRRLVEDKANGTAVLDTLRDVLDGLVPVNPRDGKEVRARAITPEVEAGNVLLPHPSEEPWVNDLLSELRSFPHDAHDDQVDALTQALWDLRKAVVSRIGNPTGTKKPQRARTGSLLTATRINR